MAATVEDVVDLLKQQMDLSKIANTVATATQQLLQKQISAAAGNVGIAANLRMTPAFDRPQPVVVMGPKPLPVSGDGPGGKSGPPAGSPKPKEDEPGFFGRLWQRSSLGRKQAEYKQRMGDLLGVKRGGGGGAAGPKFPPVGGGGAGGMAGGAAMAARAAGAVGVVIAVGMALNEMRKAIEAATAEQLNAARKLREMSGRMDVVFAQTDIKDELRQRRQGDAQADSTQRLANADQNLKDAWEPLEDSLANIKNDTLSVLNDVLVPAIQACAAVAKFIENNWPFSRDKGDKEDKKPEPIGLAADVSRFDSEAARIEAEGRRMMDTARAAGRGNIYPSGGRVP